MFNYYKVSKDTIKQLSQKQNLTEEKWNEYAKENGLFSSKSIGAILEVNTWEVILQKVKEEV